MTGLATYVLGAVCMFAGGVLIGAAADTPKDLGLAAVGIVLYWFGLMLWL